jgi:hypothetical protein
MTIPKLLLCCAVSLVLWAGIIYVGWAVSHLVGFGELFR